ncbi:MAG: hypothetical protein JO372_22215 [Solirubrobacterales bacterium]|nr:hypothetical protein [Solirubrobacterales bacterium]
MRRGAAALVDALGCCFELPGGLELAIASNRPRLEADERFGDPVVKRPTAAALSQCTKGIAS